MKAKDFVLSKYPNATAFPSIDNRRGQTSYVILKYGSYSDHIDARTFEMEIFPNEGAETASKAWTNAKKHILSEIRPKEEDYTYGAADASGEIYDQLDKSYYDDLEKWKLLNK